VNHGNAERGSGGSTSEPRLTLKDAMSKHYCCSKRLDRSTRSADIVSFICVTILRPLLSVDPSSPTTVGPRRVLPVVCSCQAESTQSRSSRTLELFSPFEPDSADFLCFRVVAHSCVTSDGGRVEVPSWLQWTHNCAFQVRNRQSCRCCEIPAELRKVVSDNS
jgi:hypothetical protein